MKFLIVEPSPTPFSSLLGPNIRLRILFSNALSLKNIDLDGKMFISEDAAHKRQRNFPATWAIVLHSIVPFKFERFNSYFKKYEVRISRYS